ncbi:hypothetical protein CR513_09625, partial [Mucuna pruriens]
MFQQVEINIPLLDAIKQVPKYAKFLKELKSQLEYNQIYRENAEILEFSQSMYYWRLYLH